jgi:hypothetical protein
VAIENVTADPFRFLFGYGSGLSQEMNGRILHNSVFQSFFDHGVLGLICVLMNIRRIGMSTGFAELYAAAIIFALVFDPFWSYLIALLPMFCGSNVIPLRSAKREREL